MMSFLYFCCIEALLTYLLRTNKTAIFITSLLINCLLSVFTSHPLLQDLLLIESLCFLFYYYSDRLLSEIIFYLSFLTVIKNLVVLIPISPIVSLIIYILIISTFAIIQKLYPIDNKNLYWGLLMAISLSTLCIYHILYNDFLNILGINCNLIILITLLITIIISYYLFLRYTKLNHEQQLLNQAIDHFKNDQQNYAFIEKKNNELYKLRHDLKYDYLQMKEYVNEMIDKRIKSLNDHNMLIISGNKLFDSFINMKLEQLKLNNIKPAIIVSIQDISFIEDEHLNILINYLFDIAIDCMENNELEVKITEDQCAFEITLYMNDAKERINQMKYDTVTVLSSKMIEEIAKILKDEGYISNYKITKNTNGDEMVLDLKYSADKKERVITGLKRISKPGLRVYAKHDELPRVLNGLGIAIISTSEGLMTDKNARSKHLGGEVLAYIW